MPVKAESQLYKEIVESNEPFCIKAEACMVYDGVGLSRVGRFLICKEKDNLVAQYALEASSLPLGISEYDLARLYPEKVEGTISTIDELDKGILSEGECKE